MLAKIKPVYESRLILALGLHSAAIIAFQLVLMQLISLMQWYHFAYMIISIAMLGFGAAGTILALFKNRLLTHSQWVVPLLMALSGMFMVISFYLARLPLFQFDVYLIFVERAQFPILAANYLIFFMPFFLGAIAIGILFMEHAKHIGRYYFSNLLGSGLGGLFVVFLLSRYFAIDALPATASLSVMAAIIIFQNKRKLLNIAAISLGIATVFYALFIPGSVPLSEYKSLSRTLHLPEAEIILSKPDIHGKIDVVESPALRYAPATSLKFTGNVPVKKHLYSNAEFHGVIPHFDTSRTNIHDYTTEALPYITAPRDTILILKATTGPSVAHALQNNAQMVFGVVEVKGVKELMQQDFSAASNNLFHHPQTEIVYQDSRQFLFSVPDNHFDAIILPRMESFGGSTGLNALNENYSMTIEAFGQMWDKLSPSGVIAISSWMDYPPRTTLKIASTLVKTLRKKNIKNPSEHIAAVRSWGTITFIIKKTPLNSVETERIRDFAQSMLFDPALLPDISPAERLQYNQLEDDSFFKYLDSIVHSTSPKLFNDYDFHIEPATDDKPYFSRFLKPGTLNKLQDEFGAESMPFLELGYLIVWVTLIQGALLALILIVLPLFRLRGTSRGKTPTVLYFGALGLGYMFVEIILIQRFVLYFGHPIYAISAVISTMMIASGLGSLISGKVKNPFKAARFSNLTVAVLLLGYILFLTPLLTNTISFPLAVKILIAFVLLAIPSLFMGMPFPSGIRILNVNKSDQIPWAWGINGSLSVIATSIATLTAVEFGFRLVMTMALVCYLVAFFVFFRKNP